MLFVVAFVVVTIICLCFMIIHVYMFICLYVLLLLCLLLLLLYHECGSISKALFCDVNSPLSVNCVIC